MSETTNQPPFGRLNSLPETTRRNQVGLRLGEMLPGSTDNGELGVPVTGKQLYAILDREPEHNAVVILWPQELPIPCFCGPIGAKTLCRGCPDCMGIRNTPEEDAALT